MSFHQIAGSFQISWPNIKRLVENIVRTQLTITEFVTLTKRLRELVAEKGAEIENLQSLEERHHEYNIAYESFKEAARATASVFRHFDSQWHSGQNEGPRKSTIYDHCMTIWKEEMFEKSYAAIMKSVPKEDLSIQESVTQMKEGLAGHLAYCMTTADASGYSSRRGSKELARVRSLRRALNHNAWIG
ncbi:hypothetical protein QR680_014763 [Steinernema hermaphroditum]|uniref:Uncharacterized protein n=1 Tax=Steinernema hermaphroditum TaxID=289476 RepID=A0AA39ICL4_9BILA|nr:hypothetical protein QR680_014763 [Steinernema hermaphroditum]